MDERTPEDWLEDYQNGRVSPLGRALRTTFDAENHETLGRDVTGLMIDLSKIPYRDEDAAPGAPPRTVTPEPPVATPRPSRFGWIAELFGRRAI